MSQENKYELDSSLPDDNKHHEESPPKRKKGDAFHGKKYRYWFFTWNNPTMPLDKDNLLQLHEQVQYTKFQLEKGDEGTPHLQGVLLLRDKFTCSWVSKMHPKCGYWQPVKSLDDALAYVSKEVSRIAGPWEAGTVPQGQGHRTDLDEVKAIIDSGATMQQVFERSFSNAVRYTRGLSTYHSMVNSQHVRKWQTKCYAYCGDAGTGKTEAAKIESAAWGGGVYWLTLESGAFGKVWWDGYEGQENVIVDEFQCQLKLSDFKRLVDSSPYRLPIKGGTTQFLAKRIWFISNEPLDLWYYRAARPGPHRNAFMRRIHVHTRFDDKFLGFANYELFKFERERLVDSQKNLPRSEGGNNAASCGTPSQADVSA